MASDSGRSSADDDPAALATTEAVDTDRPARTGDQWPVDEHYYVEPDGTSPPGGAALEADDGPETAPAGSARRRLVPSFDLGLLLAAIAVLVAVAAGAVFLLFDEQEPAASTGPTTPTLPSEPSPDTATAPATDTRIAVADVEGMPLSEARTALGDQGVRVRVTRSQSERPRGEILDQEPPPGSDVPKGTVIALVVSDGAKSAPERIEVPDVTGLSASRAVATLRDAGLAARVRLVPSSERPGDVLGQSPTAGASVARDAVVQLEVARARPTVQRVSVPDVVGTTAAAARRELRAAGLSVATLSAPSQEPAGTVIMQSPRAGAELRRGARVTLTVSTGPAKVDVPEVTGLDEASARAELERAGFQVRVTDESTTDPARDGTVVRQTPQGGSSAEESAIVTITVARLG